MEQKLVRVPFDIEMAKRIQNGEIEGRIVTRDGNSARIICFDANSKNPIIALVDYGEGEIPESYTQRGFWNKEEENELDCDLMLEIPKYLTFKDGDILRAYDNIVIIKNPHIDEEGNFNFKQYAGYNCKSNDLVDVNNYMCQECVRYATSEEKEVIKKAMQESGNPMYDGVLKNIFGIEKKKEHKFEIGQPVLGWDGSGLWRYDFYSHTLEKRSNHRLFVCVGRSYVRCIPYNKQTAHLLGTTDNWEE